MNVADKERMEYQKWLAGLKVGDAACFADHGYQRTYVTLTLAKETKTQFVFHSASQSYNVRKVDGKIIGVDYRTIKPVTQKVLKEIQDESLYRWGRNIADDLSRKRVDLKAVKAMKEAYEKATAKSMKGAKACN